MSASDSGAVSPVPEHLRTVTPRLVVSDGAAQSPSMRGRLALSSSRTGSGPDGS
jgi:hypothetical protein